jgi:hypothetical protein
VDDVMTWQVTELRQLLQLTVKQADEDDEDLIS